MSGMEISVLVFSILYGICCELIAAIPALKSNSVMELVVNILKTLAGKNKPSA